MSPEIVRLPAKRGFEDTTRKLRSEVEDACDAGSAAIPAPWRFAGCGYSDVMILCPIRGRTTGAVRNHRRRKAFAIGWAVLLPRPVSVARGDRRDSRAGRQQERPLPCSLSLSPRPGLIHINFDYTDPARFNSAFAPIHASTPRPTNGRRIT